MSKQTFAFDFDDTITAAPKQISRIAKGLQAIGDEVVVLTGNQMPRKQLLKALDDLDFPYDKVVQYDDSGSNGVERAKYLKQLDAWCALDNRIDRAVIFAPVCPHLYLVTEPTKDEKQDADDSLSKKQVKKDIKNQNRSVLLHGGPMAGQHHEHRGLADTLEFKVNGETHLYRIHASTDEQAFYQGQA